MSERLVYPEKGVPACLRSGKLPVAAVLQAAAGLACPLADESEQIQVPLAAAEVRPALAEGVGPRR